tara:strand:- start:731 stop:1540 length:810 start_codon:yes stop_codon:yes gene_type:complete
MVFHIASLIGKRESNEDEELCIENINNINNTNNINIYGIFDGHGGNEVSTYLKKNIPKYFFNKSIDYNNLNKLRKYIKLVYGHCQKKLEEKLKQKSYQVGSTALIIILFKNFLYTINLGDCRAIICVKDNFPLQISKDHKPNAYDEKIRIEKLGGSIYFDGHDWRIKDLSVSRSFGDVDSKPYLSHIPDMFKYTLNNQSKFIVLGCDGLWDVLSNQDVNDFILNEVNINKNIINQSQNNNNNIAYKLAKYAIEKGSTDNVSVIIKFLKL